MEPAAEGGPSGLPVVKGASLRLQSSTEETNIQESFDRPGYASYLRTRTGRASSDGNLVLI